MKKIIISLFISILFISCQKEIDIRDSIVGRYNCSVSNLNYPGTGTSDASIVLLKATTTNRVNMATFLGGMEIDLLCDVSIDKNNTYILSIIPNQTYTYKDADNISHVFSISNVDGTSDGTILIDNNTINFKYKLSFYQDNVYGSVSYLFVGNK